MRRKFKIIPSVLLLVLCLGILGVGIYAAKPASNSISGTVTVNAANAEVEIEVYKNGIANGNKIVNGFNTRTGSEIDLGTSNLTFVRKASAYAGESGTTEEKQSLARANTIDEVEDIELFFKIYNHSSKKLAVYFNTGSAMTSDIGTMVTTGGVAKATAEANIIDHKDMGTNALVTAYLSEYVELPLTSAGDLANEDYSVAYASVTLHLNRLIESPDVSIDLEDYNLFLNVEPYYESISNEKKDIVIMDVGNLIADDKHGAPGFPDSPLEYDGNDYYAVEGTGIRFTVTSEVNKEVDVGRIFGADLSVVIVPDYVCLGGGTQLYTVTSLGAVGFSLWGTDGISGVSTHIKLPKKLRTITGTNGLQHGGFSSIKIPSSVTRIGDDTFTGCTGLTSITIPSSVTSIGNGAFYGCTGLASVVIPSSVINIGTEVFSSCTNLAIIEIYSEASGASGIADFTSSSITTLVIGSNAGLEFANNIYGYNNAAQTGQTVTFKIKSGIDVSSTPLSGQPHTTDDNGFEVYVIAFPSAS